jgi:hypothetical protein
VAACVFDSGCAASPQSTKGVKHVMEVASVSGSGEIWQAEQTGRLKLYLPRTALVAPAGVSVERVVDIFGMSTFPCKSGFARVARPEH